MRYFECFGKKSSRIILGTAYYGDGISKEDAFSMMDKFREHGGTHIDTARLYANGISEEFVGDWKKFRAATEMIISTKGGYYDTDAGESSRINETCICHDLDLSLKALKCDAVDFYWLHKDDEQKPVEEIIYLMNKLVKMGKIRLFGASNWRSERIAAANKFAVENGLLGFSASQIRFNPAYCLGERSGLVGIDSHEFEFYKTTKMPLVAYSSQAKGFFAKMAEFGEESLSEKAKKRYLCPENLNRLKVLTRLAEKYNASVSAIISGAFSSFENPVVFPVIAGSRITQIEDTLGGADIKIEESELAEIFKLNI